MDVQMPHDERPRGDRRDPGRGSRPAGRRVPIMAMTAHAMASDREACLEAGMDGYVSKPIRLEELLAAIDAHRRRLRPAPADGVPETLCRDLRAARELRGDPASSAKSSRWCSPIRPRPSGKSTGR